MIPLRLAEIASLVTGRLVHADPDALVTGGVELSEKLMATMCPDPGSMRSDG